MSELGGSKRKTSKKRADKVKAPSCFHDRVNVITRSGPVTIGNVMWAGDQTMMPIGMEFSDIFSARCPDCSAQLSLGESNEAPMAIELRAAEIAAMAARAMSDQEAVGYAWHPRWDVECGILDGSFLVGWLASEIDSHDDRETRDATAWPWDPTRPVADQQAEIAFDSLRAWAKDNMKTTEEFEADRALDDLDSDNDAPTLESITYVKSVIGPPPTLAPTTPLLEPDDLDPPTDPATKFGELAAQVVAPVTGTDGTWICPVASQECAIRRKCTNKCDPAGIEESLAHLESDPADSRVTVEITLGPPEDLEMMMDGEPLIDGIYTERQLTDATAAEDAMRDPAVTARNAAVIREHTRHDVAASFVRHDDIEHGGEK